MNPAKNVIVYSLAAKAAILRNALNRLVDTSIPVVLLTSHKLLPLEREDLKNSTSLTLEFSSFYEFIDQKEMEWCDAEADRLILEKYGDRICHIGEFYGLIKKLKNQVISKNIRESWDVKQGFVLDDETGVDADEWIKAGFDGSLVETPVAQKRELRWRGLWRGLKTPVSVQILSTPEKSFYFFGKAGRIEQYLDMDRLQFRPAGNIECHLLVLMFNLVPLTENHSRSFLILNRLVLFVLRWAFRIIAPGKKALPILSPNHEDDDHFGALAAWLGVEMFYLQDGYLPKYYPSAYLRYRRCVSKFYVWDKPSAELLESHHLGVEIWTGFSSQKLKPVQECAVPVSTVVMLTSGAGDWTAIKSRSDEDSAFEAFIEVARALPDVRVIYRPHPLWMHKDHQGIDSIARLVRYAEKLKLPNFEVSSGALKEGRDFLKKYNLSVKPTTIKNEIEEADVIFGDHSQALVRAMQDGKAAASVSLANRKELFCNYTDLGFPCLRSAEEIVKFIKGLSEGTDVARRINLAVEVYNKLNGWEK